MQIETNLYKSLNNKHKINCGLYISKLKVFCLFIDVIEITFLLFWFKSTHHGLAFPGCIASP